MTTTMGRKAKKAWMEPHEFKAIREGLDRTQAEFAALLDVSSTAVSGYENGRTPIPRTLMILMKAVKTGKIKLS